MREINRFYELDKQVTNEIMPKFKGKTTDVICPDCKGKGCEYCEYTGHYELDW